MSSVADTLFDQLSQYLSYVQLAAIILGIAATVYMDMKLFRLYGKGRITKRLYLRLRLINKVSVFAALVVWSTLLIQISHYGVVDPSALNAQDLWARISIGTVLGLNLYLIRHLALPKARRRIGLSIYGSVSNKHLNRMLGIGAISSISWASLLLLWMIGEDILLVSFAESYPIIMSIYVILVVVALVFGRYYGRWMRRRFFKKLEVRRKKHHQAKVKRTAARRDVTAFSTHHTN